MRGFRRPKTCRPAADEAPRHTREKISGTQGTRSSDFVNHSYDYRLNWTPLGPITIINYFSVSTWFTNLFIIIIIIIY